MKNKFKNKSIDIDGTEFLAIIKSQYNNRVYSPTMRGDIKNIIDMKKMDLDNIDELFRFLMYVKTDSLFYYEGFKALMNHGMSLDDSIKRIDGLILDNNTIFTYLVQYIDYKRIDNETDVLVWRDDNESK